jgi:hypothetical protein
VVSNVATYFFAASMHIGGSFSKDVARLIVPSAAGHGVSPVMASPGTVVSAGTESSAGRVSSTCEESSPPVTEMAITMTRSRPARPPHFRARPFTLSRRCRRASASRAAALFCFCLLRLSVPTGTEGYL